MKKSAAIFLLCIITGSMTMAYEQPKYTVIKTDGAIEIREYLPYIVAETFISSSDMDDASSAAFKKLFKYISGSNRSNTEIPMTSPVITERSEKIEMTVPVTTSRTADGYTVAFVVPEKYTLASAPVPSDSSVHLREVPARTAAVIRFSGRWTESNMTEHEQELREWLKAHSYTPIGMPLIARYDPPFVPWFLRRNEVQIEVSR